MEAEAVRFARGMLVAGVFLAAFPLRSPVASAQQGAEDPELAGLLERAGQYVLDYEKRFQSIVAEESYTQWTERREMPTTGLVLSCSATSCRRHTRADVAFVSLGGDVPWGTLRDVFEVDGQPVRDREGRLEELLLRPSLAGAAQRAREILQENARYNIGPAVRTVNFPTLPLAFLHPRNRGRFSWTRGGTRRFDSVEAVELRFEEVGRPTMVQRGDRGDLPATGRFWIDPHAGTVVRSETWFDFASGRARAAVKTQYRPEPELAMWVPAEMREEYEDLQGARNPVFGSSSGAVARYSDFRRFTVTVEDEVRLPGP